jgi:hypothetical protein
VSVTLNGQPHPGEEGAPPQGPAAVTAGVHAIPGSSPGAPGSPPTAGASNPPLLPSDSGSLAELRRLRVELAERVASLTWDLGGLTYEMAVRDHYRLDVLARRAAELQQADAQLGEVERLLATTEAGVGGACRACGSVHSRGAAYCWHCGSPLLREGRPAGLAEPAGSPEL